MITRKQAFVFLNKGGWVVFGFCFFVFGKTELCLCSCSEQAEFLLHLVQATDFSTICRIRASLPATFPEGFFISWELFLSHKPREAIFHCSQLMLCRGDLLWSLATCFAMGQSTTVWLGQGFKQEFTCNVINKQTDKPKRPECKTLLSPWILSLPEKGKAKQEKKEKKRGKLKCFRSHLINQLT